MSWKSPNRVPGRASFIFTIIRFIVFHTRGRRLFLVMFLTAASSVLAQGPGIEVVPVSPGIITTGPGEIITFAIRVTNRAGVQEELRETIDLPPGWRAVMPPLDFILEPNEAVSRLIAVQVGRAAPAGDYEMLYKAASRRDHALADRAVVRVSVMPVYDLFLQIEDKAPERVVAGEPFSLRVRLVNRGNAELAVTMDLRFTSEGQATVIPEAFRLPAGENRLLEVSARANPAEEQLRRSHLRIEARTDRTVSGRPVTARLSVPVDVVPLVAGKDMYLRYPVKFFARFGGDDNDSGLQFGLHGNGYLDENRLQHLEFLLQAPDRQDDGVLGRRDEYWLRYKEPRYSVLAGDQAYALSPLTSWYRYGRGLGADLHPPDSPLGAGLYHVQDRWAYQERADTAAYLSFTPRPGVTLRLNHLFLDYDAWETEPAAQYNLFSVQAEVDFPRKDHLEAEVGFSDSEQQEDEKDTAWRLAYRNPPGAGVRYALSGRRAEPDYAGRYPDSAWFSGSFSVPLTETLRGNVSYRRYEQNLDLDPERGTAPREDLYQAGLNARLPERWYLSLDYDYYDRRDDLPVPSYEFEEHGLSLGVGRTGKRFNYRVKARRGWTEDRLTGDHYNGWNYSLYGTFTPNRVFYLSLYSTFGDDDSPDESRLLRRGRSLGGTIRWEPVQTLSAYVHYARNDQTFPDEDLRERVKSDLWGAGITWKMPRGQSLEISARRSDNTSNDARTSYFATWTIPFNVPLARKKSVGAITGRVYRSDTPGHPGIEGAVVYADGTAAVTDSDGRFLFRTLSPAPYELRVEEQSVGLDSVPAVTGPVQLRVIGGKTSEGDIALVQSGSLSGRVVRISASNAGNGRANNNGSHVVGNGYNGINGNQHASAPQEANGQESGLANLLVELSRPEETRRTVTDKNGGFLFQRLLPDTWTLKVYSHNLPEQHALEKDQQPVVIAPGAQAQVTVRVIPRVREIRFIDNGRISPSGGQ